MILLLASISGRLDWFSSSYERVVNYQTAYEPPAPFQFFVINDKLEAIENKNYIGRSSGPGCIEFSYGEYNQNTITKHAFLPITGQLFMFPASLQHSVNSFQSDVERISVSGNLKFEYKEHKYI